MRRPRSWCFLVLLLAVAGTSCRSDKTSDVSVRLRQLTAAKPPSGTRAAVWKDVAAFYATREFRPAWVTDHGVGKAAARAVAALDAAESHGLRPASYGAAALAALIASLDTADLDHVTRVERLAEAEIRMTRALMTLGRDVASGRGRPEAIDPRWTRQRQAPDLPGTLNASSTGDLIAWMDSVQPAHPEYVALRTALAALRARVNEGGWPAVPPVALRSGRRHDAVVLLRDRLRASGDHGPEVPRDARLFDADLKAAVQSFQAHHGLPQTGSVDPPTLAALNVPLERRMAQIEINLERWRWMTNELGDTHLFVNVPAYHLTVRENRSDVRDIRVVIGRIGDETPVFSDRMTTIVFSPYWNIPETIATAETLPAFEDDPDYLAANNIEIVRKHSPDQAIEPSTIDWDDGETLSELSFRQRPGPGNALGHVKFLFPNPFNVYIHDTPADSLFERPRRAFSHGCVRIEEPETLAEYLLRHQPEWTSQAIARAMHLGIERHVKLPQPVPIHIVYFTAWIDPRGGLHFRDDVYGYDARQLRSWPGPTSRTS